MPTTNIVKSTHPVWGAKRLAQAGQQMYEKHLRRKLEPRHMGKIVAIDVRSGDYFIGDTLHEATQKAREKYPESVFYAVKVGFPAVYSFSARMPIAATGL